MNYRHGYHAGNFADVFKHLALVALLHALQRKDAPFCYIDTHAGAGRYDLDADEARRSGEYHDGIARLWPVAPPEALRDYLALVREFNPDDVLRTYPGSPLLARRCLRAQDRMVLCEQHPDEHARLRTEFAGDRQVAVHRRNGYEVFKALLPPAERRGLVLVDPPYEAPQEFERILAGLDTAAARWPGGTYALWYPVKERAPVTRFCERLQQGEWKRVWCAELMLFPEDTAFRLNGCGLAVVNPPWGFDEVFGAALPSLQVLLSRGVPARVSTRWLIEEA